ncbi:cupin domain-containing protein [Natronoarchaeum mannanilyticum]|uniref:Cupin domain-containing protein n=1 Tax=Natronoarchaeum mannanilyticum TaxID=926360 RepID=A0AAV3TBH2_9EURY
MPKVNESDLDWDALERGEAKFRRKRLADAAGGDDLGCSLYELPPGKKSWPYHYHTANEEAIYVLEGEGQLRRADDATSLEPGDYVALPTGEDGAHRIINDSDATLRYLAVSTMETPEVLVYPDSGKVGVMDGAPPGGTGERTLEGYFREDDAVDYWDGERGDAE